MQRSRSGMVWALAAVVAVFAILTGCTGTMPETKEQTMTIKGHEGDASAREQEISPAERAANSAAEFVRVREIGKAIENYQKAINLDPGYVEAYYGLGRLYLIETQEFDKSLEMYKKGTELAPDDPYSHTSLAYAHFVTGEYQQSVEEYVLAVQLDFDNEDAYLNLGYAYEKMEMDLAAINAYRRAHELSPTDSRAVQSLAQLYYRAELYDQAIVAYE